MEIREGRMDSILREGNSDLVDVSGKTNREIADSLGLDLSGDEEYGDADFRMPNPSVMVAERRGNGLRIAKSRGTKRGHDYLEKAQAAFGK